MDIVKYIISLKWLSHLIYVIKVTMWVCLFSIGGHYVGPTVLKFGMEYHIYPGEVIGYISFGYPLPPGSGEAKFCSIFQTSKWFSASFIISKPFIMPLVARLK